MFFRRPGCEYLLAVFCFRIAILYRNQRNLFSIETLFVLILLEYIKQVHWSNSGLYNLLLLPAALFLFIWSTAANELEIYEIRLIKE